MKLPLTLICLSLFQLTKSQLAYSQVNQKAAAVNQSLIFIYPDMPKYGKSLDEFVPKNWKIIDTAIGDLNKDKIADAAIVLEYQKLVKEKSWFTDKQETYPRVLIIVFKKDDHYELKLQHNTFIVRDTLKEDNYGNVDYGPKFRDIEIKKGVLHIHFSSSQPRVVSNYYYLIRYQLNDFYLIGAKSEALTSGESGGYDSRDYNFSTKVGIIRSQLNTSSYMSETPFKLPANSLKKLSEFIDSDSVDQQ